jgi:outer membrane protein assembly factor BamB
MTQINRPSAIPARDVPATSDGQTIAVRPVTGAPIPPQAKPPGDTRGYPRLFANDRRNSRVENVLPRGNWQVKWQTDLDAALRPSAVLQEAEHILIPGAQQWLLFAANGTVLQNGAMGGGEASFDRAHDLFYATSASRMIVAYHANNGDVAFKTNGYGWTNNKPNLIVRRGNLLLDVSPGARVRPRAAIRINTGIRVQDLGDPPQVGETGILTSGLVRASAPRETFRLLAAMHDDTLVLGFGNRIQFLNLQLQVQTELTGEFDPQEMSLDETARVYLIVQTQAARSLWVITPKGECVLTMRLSPQQVSTPPIIGYDHRIYLAEADRLMAISPQGQLLWEHKSEAAMGGAIVTADDWLVAAIGNQIVSFDSVGKATILYAFEGEQLKTPPVLTVRGELLVASIAKLYCLAVAVEK